MDIDGITIPPEFAQELRDGVSRQQLVGRIKRTSKYYGQTAPGKWFDVRIVNDRSYPVRGNNNNYRRDDLAFGIRLDEATVVELK
jgi:hypothetical protein